MNMSLKKYFFLFISILIIYICFIGISCPKKYLTALNKNLEKKTKDISINIEKIKIFFPNVILLDCFIDNTDYSIDLKDLKINLDLFNIIKDNKKIFFLIKNPKNLSKYILKINIKNFNVLIKESKKTKKVNKIKNIKKDITEIFNEIFSLNRIYIEIKSLSGLKSNIDFFYKKHHKFIYILKNILFYKNILGKEILITDIFINKNAQKNFVFFKFNIENFIFNTQFYNNKNIFFTLSNKISSKLINLKFFNNMNSLEYKFLSSKFIPQKIKNIFKNIKILFLKFLNITYIKKLDYKILKNILNFYEIDIDEIQGTILCNISLFLNLDNILLKNEKPEYSSYGNILTNIKLKYKNVFIDNVKFNANINKNLLTINNGQFKINGATGNFNILSKNIFNFPNKIKLKISNMHIIEFFNKNLTKFIDITNNLELNLSLNKNNKYNGKISLNKNFIKINKKNIKLKDIIINIKNNNINLDNIPILSSKNNENLFLLNCLLNFKNFLNFSIFATKPIQLKEIINIDNLKVFKNKNLEQNNFYKYLSNINLENFFIDFKKDFINKHFILSQKSSFFYKNQKIYFEIKNQEKDILEIDFSKNKESLFYLKFKIFSKDFEIKDLYLFNKKIDFINDKKFFYIKTKDFILKNKDFLLSFDIKFFKEKRDFSIFLKLYNTNFNFEFNAEYKNKILKFNKISINNNAFLNGFYNFYNKNYEIYLNTKDFFLNNLNLFYISKYFFNKNISQFLKQQNLILNGNFNIKKYFNKYKINSNLLFSNINKEKILNIIFNDKSKMIDFFQKNIKKISLALDNNSFSSITFEKNKQKDFLIKGTVKNLLYKNFNISFDLKNIININNITNVFFEAKNIKINEEKFQFFYFYIDLYENIINLKEFSLDNKINGYIKKEKSYIDGKINFLDLDIKNFLNQKNINSFILKGDFNISQKTSSIKNFKIEANNFKVLIKKEKNPFKFLLNISFYQNILDIKNSKIFIKNDEKINFSTKYNINKIFNITLDLKNFTSDDLNKFIDISSDIFSGEIEKGNININFSDLNKIEIDTNLNLKNSKIFTMNAENLDGKLFFYPKQKKIEFKNIKILEEKKSKNVHLFIKENSNIFFNKNDIMINLLIYMKNWSLFGINKGLGNIFLFMQINSDNLSGQAELSNFWVSDYVFKNEILKFSLKNNIFNIESLKNDLLSGKIIFDNGNIIIDNFLYKNIKKDEFLSCDGEIFANKDVDLKIKTKNLDAEIITKLFYFGFYIYGKTNLDIKISGNLLFDPIININFSSINGKFDILSFEKLYGNVEINKDKIKLNNIYLSYKNKYTLLSYGYIPYSLLDEEKNLMNKQKMLIKVQSLGANLGILEKLYPDIIVKANGETNFNFDLTNSLDDIKISGKISILKGTIFFKDGLKNIKHINSNIDISNNKLIIKSFNASSGKGKIKILGDILLKDLKFKYFNLDIQIPSKKGIKIELDSLKIPQQSFIKIFPSISSKINFYGNVKMIGDIDKYFLKGNIFVYNTNFTYNNNNNSDLDSIIKDTILEGMNFDLDIKTIYNVWFENQFCNLAIEGNANLKGKINDIIVNSDINFLRGDINYMNIYFKIKEGNFSLVNNEPFLALKAETNISRYDDTFNRNVEDTIKLTIDKSHISNIKFKFESQNFPSTTKEEAMSLALSGQNSGQTTQEKEEKMRQEFFRIIDNTITAPLAKIFLQSTSLVDFVNFNTNIANKTLNKSNNNPYFLNNNKNSNILVGSSLKLGKYLNSNFFVSYSLSLEENDVSLNYENNSLILQHEIEAKIKLKKNLYLKGLIELNSIENASKEKQVSLEYSFPILNGRAKI